MHKPLISTGVDRLLAVAILLSLLGGAYVLVWHVYIGQLTELNRALEVNKRKHARIDSILESEKELQSRIAQLESQVQKNKLFLNNNNAATAASELQNYVKKLVGANSDARISSIKPYPVKAYDDYSETSIEVSLVGLDHEDLQRLLYHIENNAPVLLVRELDIMVPRRRYKPIIEDQSETTRLTVSMVVSGFFREASG